MLFEARAHIIAEDFTAAHRSLAQYWVWRAGGGFEPTINETEGDIYAAQLRETIAYLKTGVTATN